MEFTSAIDVIKYVGEQVRDVAIGVGVIAAGVWGVKWVIKQAVYMWARILR